MSIGPEAMTRVQLVGEYALQHMAACPDLEWSQLLGYLLWVSLRDAAKPHILNRAKALEKTHRGERLAAELVDLRNMDWSDWIDTAERVEGRYKDPETDQTQVALYLSAAAMASEAGVPLGLPVLDSTEAMPITNKIAEVMRASRNE